MKVARDPIEVAAEREGRIAEVLKEGIVPDRLYEPYLAAALLGFRSIRADKTLAEIPASLLAPHRVGGRSGRKRYYGRNLLAYIRATGPVPDDEEAQIA